MSCCVDVERIVHTRDTAARSPVPTSHVDASSRPRLAWRPGHGDGRVLVTLPDEHSSEPDDYRYTGEIERPITALWCSAFEGRETLLNNAY